MSAETPVIRQLAPEGMLRAGFFSKGTDCLGPGTRFVLWVQGCGRHCPGCIAPEMQPTDGGGIVAVNALADTILALPQIGGITLSGGEPFMQADRLALLMQNVLRARPELTVIVFTGWTLEELRASGESGVSALLSVTDLLVDGEYLKALDDDMGLRGSSNQRMHFLTERIQPQEISDVRRNQWLVQENRMRMIGIPTAASKRFLAKLPGSPIT